MEANMEDMSNVNLKEFNEESGMTYMDMFLKQIPAYSNTVKIRDFQWKENYGDFKIFDISIDYDENRIFANLRLENEADEDRRYASVEINFTNSQADNIEMMRSHPWENFSSTFVRKGDIDIGDFSIADPDFVEFIRGNIFATVKGENRINITDLANAIDQQIRDMFVRCENES